MVLLTVPGTGRKAVGAEEKSAGKALDFRFSRIVCQVKASPDGLVEGAPDASPDANFCGTIRYSCTVELPEERRVKIVLPGAVRAMCALQVNGSSAGVRVWRPYCWSEVVLPAGKSTLDVDISGTPAPAMTAPEHLEYLRNNKFDNVYFQRCMAFEPIFPDENPLEGAEIVYLI